MRNHGGPREGAGRPKGQGKYGEPTKLVRIPVSRVTDVAAFLAKEEYKLPLYACKVRAGFPSPADDHIEKRLDLNEYLVAHPSATFFVRAAGDSMRDAGITDGDLLIVDRSLTAQHGKIVIAAVQGELTVKRLYHQHGVVKLIAANPNYPDITLPPDQELIIWGVVTHVIHEAG